MMEAVRTSETSVDNHSTRQYNPEDSSEHHTRRRENLKSHTLNIIVLILFSSQRDMKLYSLSFETPVSVDLQFANLFPLDVTSAFMKSTSIL